MASPTRRQTFALAVGYTIKPLLDGLRSATQANAGALLGAEPCPTSRYRFEPGSAYEIRKEDTWFRDAQGRYALFRGVNFGSRSKRPPYLPILPNHVTDLDLDQFYNELTNVDFIFDALKQLGFNVVRLLVSWKAIEPYPNPTPTRLLEEGKTYLRCIHDIVDALYQRGIFSIIDFHQDVAHEVCSGDGFPDWALAIDAAHPRPYPPSDLRDPAWALNYVNSGLVAKLLHKDRSEFVRHTLRSFWDNNLTNTTLGAHDASIARPVRTHLAETVGATARFLNELSEEHMNPGILGYEPFNEPHQVGISKTTFERSILPNFYMDVLSEILRMEGGLEQRSTPFLFIEPRVDWTTYAFNLPRDNSDYAGWSFTNQPQTCLNIAAFEHQRFVFSFHHYDPWTTLYGSARIADSMRNKEKEWPGVFAQIREAWLSRNMIPFLTEFGANQDWSALRTDLKPQLYQNQARAYTDLQYREIEKNLINATHWNLNLYNTYDEKDNWNKENFSMLDPNLHFLHLDIISRPYPMRSSARPYTLFFDIETRHFIITLVGEVVAAPTVIFVPFVQYPRGFDVRSTGNVLSWDSESRLLQWYPNGIQARNYLIIHPPKNFNRFVLPEEAQKFLSIPFTLFQSGGVP